MSAQELAQRILMLAVLEDGGREPTPEIVAELVRHHGFSVWNLTPDVTALEKVHRTWTSTPLYRCSVNYWSPEKVRVILLSLGWS